MINLSKQQAFTLIELLVIITLLGLLVFTSFMVLPSLVIRARDARRKSDLHKIKMALEEYYDAVGEFPEELPACNQSFFYQTENFLSAFPCDPQSKAAYLYQFSNDQQSYKLYAMLANDQDFSIVDVGCSGGCGPACAYNYGVTSTNTTLTKCAYVCAPGGGSDGSCELYQNTSLSECPVTFGGDSSCSGQCGNPASRCQNASGKHVPN